MTIQRIISAFVFIVSLLPILYSSPAQAKWADKKEAQEEILLSKDEVFVKKDGYSEVISERRIKVLTEDARSYYLRTPFVFYKSIQTFELIKATITTDKKEVNVSDLEIKETDTGGTVFNDKSVGRITFKRLKIGSIIYYKVKMTTRPVFKGLFSNNICLSSDAHYKQYSFNLESEKELIYQLNDPDNFLRLKMKKTANGFKYRVHLKRPYYRSLRTEDHRFAYSHPGSCFSFSSKGAFPKMVSSYSKKYEEIYKQKLPGFYKKTVAKEHKKNHSFRQIDRLIEALRKNIKYLGDWRLVEGRFLPRPLNDVANSGYGDCKDYATGLTALLRNLGYEAYPALIRRGYNHILSSAGLPGISSFNHVIVAVKMDGSFHYVDPTNAVVKSDVIFTDIDQRPVLILDHLSKNTSSTPAQKMTDGETEIHHFLNFKGSSKSGELHIKLKKYHAKRHTEWMMKYHKDPANVLLRVYGDSTYMENPRTISGPISRKNAILTNLSYKIQVNQIPANIRTPYGTLFKPPTPKTLLPYLINRENRFSGLSNLVGIQKFFYHLKGAKILGDLTPFQCDIYSPWLRANRKIKVSNGDSLIVDEYYTLVKSISPKEIQSKKFENLQRKIRKCFIGAAFIF